MNRLRYEAWLFATNVIVFFGGFGSKAFWWALRKAQAAEAGR